MHCKHFAIALKVLLYSMSETLDIPVCLSVLFLFQESVLLQFCGNKLDKKDFFGKSDPFLVFYRSNVDGT